MNAHIELIKKWLADPASVTQQELKDTVDAAYANAAADAAATASADADAEYWVKRYEEITK